jgi:hypothetical protein
MNNQRTGSVVNKLNDETTIEEIEKWAKELLQSNYKNWK